MNSLLEAKAMAKALRLSLGELDIHLSHSACLELVARQFGLSDWNVLAARIAKFKAKREPLRLPAGWFPTGFTDTTYYRVGLDRTAPECALIERISDRGPDPKERYACLMQSIDADPYRGTRLKLAANIRTEDADCGTIWMRIDGAGKRSLRFDNMMSRVTDGAISATTGWTSRSIVLDIPTEAESIHYGFFLKGHGKIWARRFTLEVVSDSIAITDISHHSTQKKAFPNQPVNIDFSAGST